jgi:hypothetical protein
LISNFHYYQRLRLNVKSLEGSVRLAPVRRNLFIIALVVCSVAAWGQSQTQRIFRVPYNALNASQESNVFLAAPFVRIGESWSAFSGRKPRSQEEAALQELLAALYKGDTAAAESRITPPKEVSPGKAFADYVAAFRSSLVQAAELEVEGYFPLPGRVRFVLRPTIAKIPYRLFTMRAGADGRLRFDETKAPNKVDSALNSVFRVLKDTKLEVTELPKSGYVTVAAEPGVNLTARARRINADLDKMDAQAAGDPALQFYKSCLTVPDRQSLDHYFRCFEADAQSRLRGEFAKMPDDKQEQLFAMTSASRHVDFVVENASSWIVYYHSNIYAVSSRDWIQRTSGGEFVLLNPLAFFPLDDLLSSPEIHSAIAAAVGLGRSTREPGAKGK